MLIYYYAFQFISISRLFSDSMLRVLYIAEAAVEELVPPHSQLLFLHELEACLCAFDTDFDRDYIHLLKVNRRKRK